MSGTTAQVILSCHDLTRRFDGVVALDNLMLDVHQNEVLGVIGPNGSGKTTFFNVITGIFKAHSGWVRFGRQDVTGWTPQQLHRAGISRTFQRSRLCLDLSIFDNLMIGNHAQLNQSIWVNVIARKKLRREVEQQVERCRQLLRIFDQNLANRMDNLVGNYPMIDRRSIEICRALINSPKILLLDEPSAGMTELETRKLMEKVLEVKRSFGDFTIVLIEHEMSVIERISDRCVVMNFGRKICEGSYSDVVASTEVQEAYLGTQLKTTLQ